MKPGKNKVKCMSAMNETRKHLRLPGWLRALVLVLLPTAGALADTDWVLVLDRSQSMIQNDPGNHRFDAQKIMVDLLANGVGETHRLTIIRFSAAAEVTLDRQVIEPGSLDEIRKVITDDPPKGDTDIGAALALARKTVGAEDRASEVRVILLSDGVQMGKKPDVLRSRLEQEKQAYQELGLAVHSIILNDFSISEQERTARRLPKRSYDDKLLHNGEDLLRDLARKTGGRVDQVSPERGIEDIILDIIAPQLSFYRQKASGRVRTLPSDRQLMVVLDRDVRRIKFRLGFREVEVDLSRQQSLSGEFTFSVNPYSNRTVVMIRPAEDVRWPEWIDLLPGSGGGAVEADVFVISNVRLSIVQGPGSASAGSQPREGLKIRVRENEIYPVLLRVDLAADITPDRARNIENTLEKCVARVRAADSNGSGEIIKEAELSVADILSGTGNRLFFVPTAPRGEDAKIEQSFGLVVRASLELSGAAEERPLARAAERGFTVTPSPFEWLARKSWKGEPDGPAKATSRRAIDLDLGQELRLEVVYTGAAALGSTEILANFSRAGESSATRLVLRDAGGTPRTFRTDWIFPPEPGAYTAKVSVKSDVVQEVEYDVRVVRDDFRAVDARYTPAGVDTAKPRNLGSYVEGEVIRLSRTRTIRRMTAEDTARYLEGEGAQGLKARLFRQDLSSGKWTSVQPVALSAEEPSTAAARALVDYGGQVAGLEPGDYAVLWPGASPPAKDISEDSRADLFRVVEPAFEAVLIGEDGTPLEVEEGRALHQAGKKLTLKIIPSATFPSPFSGRITGRLTWARKDVGEPQVVEAVQDSSGNYLLTFPTTDFHTGSAKLHVEMAWKGPERERLVEEDFEISSMPKALGVAVEPLSDDVLIGQRSAMIRFRVAAVGGQNLEAQRGLLSLWLSQPANVTIGESEKLYRVMLQMEQGALTGSLECPELEPGAYKLVVSSPVAKLGQDIAACFFNVRPCPFVARVVKSSSGVDQKILLEPGTSSTECEGDGALWVVFERAQTEDAGETDLQATSAELSANGRKADLEWLPTDGGGLRSSPTALENLDRQTELSASLTDDKGRIYDFELGTLSVEPMPLRHEVIWLRPPPQEMGRGEFSRVKAEIRIRGSLKAERVEALQTLRGSAASLLVVDPPSVLQSFEVLPDSELEGLKVAGSQPGDQNLFGERLGFQAMLHVDPSDRTIRDHFTVRVRKDPSAVLESSRVSVGLATVEMGMGRPAAESEDGLLSSQGVGLFARERVRVVLKDKSAKAQPICRIDVFEPETEGAAAAEPFLSVDSATAEWTPKQPGVYRVVAELRWDADSGWSTEESLEVLPPLRLEWTRKVEDGTLKVDAGEHLPLFVRIRSSAPLDWESLSSLFRLRPEVLGEGGQLLAVDFSPWELERGGAVESVAVKAFTTEPLPMGAARVRVAMEPTYVPRANVVPLDVLELELVRGGGSLVVVENYDDGPENYVLQDLVSGRHIPKNSQLRFGYRTGSSVGEASRLKNRIGATVIPLDGGAAKNLGVDSTTSDLVVFTPFEASSLGRFQIKLEIKGERTQLRQAPEFEVVRSLGDWAFLGVQLAAVGAALVGLVFLGRLYKGYLKDRQMVQERVQTRKEKALADLETEPTARLLGEARINVSGKALGPVDLDGTPSLSEVSAWVDKHFSMENALFADSHTNERRAGLIQSCLTEARTQLLAETERRLPVRGADICVSEVPTGSNGGSRPVARVFHDNLGGEHEGYRTVLCVRLLEGGKIRIATTSGRSVTVARDEDLAYNGWIGKKGDQIRASVKVPGIADYSTLTIDLK